MIVICYSILGFVLLCFLLCIAYIRIKFQFWASQPVFHLYDLSFYFYDHGVVRKEPPQKTKYTNFLDIITISQRDITPFYHTKLKHLMRHHYLSDGDKNTCKYFPNNDNIIPYFQGHHYPCFWSFFRRPILLEDTEKEKENNENKNPNNPNTKIVSFKKRVIKDLQFLGVITSRPLLLFFHSSKTKTTNKMVVYYIDHLCVDRTVRKSGIAQQLIQTHDYNQSRKNNNGIVVSFFKRETNLTGIVPLTIYKNYVFSMKKWSSVPPLPIDFRVLVGDVQNVASIYETIMRQVDEGRWRFVALPSLLNMKELVKSGNIIIIFLVVGEEIQAVYFFRKTCTFLENLNEEIVSCFASIKLKNNKIFTDPMFVHGFKVALSDLLRRTKHTYAYLSLEDISHNHLILRNILIHSKPIFVSPNAYYFYNFAYNTIPSNNLFIVN